MAGKSPADDWGPIWKRMAAQGFSDSDILRVAATILWTLRPRLVRDEGGEADELLQRTFSALLSTARIISSPEM